MPRAGSTSRFVAILVLGLALAGCSGSSGGSADDLSGGSAGGSVDDRIDAGTVADPGTTLPARWWKWAASAPDDQSPVSDSTGKSCDHEQPDDVWFLAGTFGTGEVVRTCTVPAGRDVYFPVLNTVCPVSASDDFAEVLPDCTMAADEAWAELDGKRLTVQNETSRGIFSMAPSDGSTLVDGASGDYIAAGSWVGPLAVPAGDHQLQIHSLSGTFAVDVTYKLTVG